jgi:hypothetical protein
MSSNKQLPKFAQTVPTGVVSTICALSAWTVLFQNLVTACFAGLIAIGIGFITLKVQVEKLEKSWAVIGITLAIIPIIYAILIFI